MRRLTGGRPNFREWVDGHEDPKWRLMPLTHITTGIYAEDVIRGGVIEPKPGTVFKEPLAYFFYGRPAYRLAAEGSVRVEASCPYCFIFDPGLIAKAEAIHAFDTGAFAKRMYNHILTEGMEIADFSLEKDPTRPNKLIAGVFGTLANYFRGDLTVVSAPEEMTKAWDFHARAYLHLLKSPGRNEPDDRICSIEIVIGQNVALAGNLRAVIVPHTLWSDGSKTPWLQNLENDGVRIAPYVFVPGRHPEHYHALLEAEVEKLYKEWNSL